LSHTYHILGGSQVVFYVDGTPTRRLSLKYPVKVRYDFFWFFIFFPFFLTFVISQNEPLTKCYIGANGSVESVQGHVFRSPLYGQIGSIYFFKEALTEKVFIIKFFFG
jgi:hypothetical protein